MLHDIVTKNYLASKNIPYINTRRNLNYESQGNEPNNEEALSPNPAANQTAQQTEAPSPNPRNNW